jgi:SAM-dependent methyltransferase
MPSSRQKKSILSSASVSGRDTYAGKYASDLEKQARWLEYGAIEKANSVEVLLERGGIKPVNLLELGSGTGAVIKECVRRNIALEYAAVDYSPEAIEYLQRDAPRVRCIAADITDVHFHLDETFDVIVLSHVLEHLEDPLTFLRTIKDRLLFRNLIIEVPLEDLLMPRVKALFVDRTKNAAGHVQWFTGQSFKRLLVEAGLTVRDERRFVPRMSAESVRFSCERKGTGKLRTAYKLCTTSYAPMVLHAPWKHIWYSHMAVRCTI